MKNSESDRSYVSILKLLLSRWLALCAHMHVGPFNCSLALIFNQGEMEKTMRRNKMEKRKEMNEKKETRDPKRLLFNFVGRFEIPYGLWKWNARIWFEVRAECFIAFFPFSISHARDMCGVSVSNKKQQHTHRYKCIDFRKRYERKTKKNFKKKEKNLKRKGEKPQCDR